MTLITVAYSAAIALLLSMAASIVFVQSQLSILLTALLVCFSANLAIYVIDLDSFHPSVLIAASRLSTLIPALLWLVAFRLFRGEEKFPLYIWPLICAYVLTRGIGIALLRLDVIPFTDTTYVICIVIPQIVMIGLACHAIHLALRSYNAGLMEKSRSLRIFFVVTAAFLTILARIEGWSIYHDAYFNNDSYPMYVEVNATGFWRTSTAIFAIVFSISFFIAAFKINTSFMPYFESGSTILPSIDIKKHRLLKSDQQLVTKLKNKINCENRYRETGLTIKLLANELGVHQNRLRSIITNYFGARNFNQFLNLYRLKDVEKALQTTDEPISTIAYNAGFASLSVFNTMFKSKFGVTPSEFRSRSSTLKEFEGSEVYTKDSVNRPNLPSDP